MKHLLIFVSALILLIGCNTTSPNTENPDSIFGYWKLDRIDYESGEVLRPGDGDSSPTDPKEEIHILGFLEIDVQVEGENHKKLNGESYCNNLDGSFNKKPGRKLEMNIVATRAGCGISPEFISAVKSSHSYLIKRGNLHLSFEYPREQETISGQVILAPFDPTN